MRLTTNNIPQILSSIGGSTCCVDYPQIVQLLEPLLNARAGRADAAALRSMERSTLLRGAVQKAIGALPLDRRTSELAHIVQLRISSHLSVYGVSNAPSMTLIRDEIDCLKSCRASTEA